MWPVNVMIVLMKLSHRMRQNEPEHALPTLYLIDSILKNVGGVYIQLFGDRIFDAFAATFTTVRYNRLSHHAAHCC